MRFQEPEIVAVEIERRKSVVKIVNDDFHPFQFSSTRKKDERDEHMSVLTKAFDFENISYNFSLTFEPHYLTFL